MAETSPLGLYLVAVFVLFGVFAVAAVYVGRNRNLERAARRFGVPRRYALVAALLGVLAPAVLALAGSLRGFEQFAEMGRYEFRSHGFTLLLNWGLFVVGLLGSASAAGNFRTYYDLVRSPTDGDARVAVSGLAEGDPEPSPVTRRAALCWNWRFEVYELYGFDDDNWTVRGRERGGVPFRVDADSGAVRVDPAEARLDLVDERTTTLEPDESLSGSVTDETARKLARDYADHRRRFVESALAPGTAATAVGPLADGEDVRTLETADGRSVTIHEGSASAVRSRYRLRAAGAALFGTVATWFGGRYLLGFFGL